MFFTFVSISLIYLASANAVAALANSLGCKLKLPKLYQEVAPDMVLPKTNSPIKESSAII